LNEEFATIERENRAFWARILRERFDRDVELEIDWDSFEKDSADSGWPLYPLNIQQAGVERLLYAITGLMDKDEKFRAGAIDSIDSIHVSSAKDIHAVQFLFHKGRITYQCFAGDWNGYFTIEQMQQYLDDKVPRKTKLRRMLEGWIRGLSAAKKEEPVQRESASEPTPEPEQVECEPDPDADELSEQEHTPKRTIPPYDKALRGELESLYNAFIHALKDKNLEQLLRLVDVTKTDEETLRSEQEQDGFAGFSEWLLATYPSLEQANFISLKTEEDDLAGYYVAWLPPYTREYLNLTLVRYLKTGGEWKMVFRLAEMTSAPFCVREDEDTLAKALEVMETNPLLLLDRPERVDDLGKPHKEPKLSKGKARLKEELEAVLATVYDSLERRDVNAFLSAVAVSQSEEKKLRKKSRRLLREIFENTPDPSKAVFVRMKTKGHRITGYYSVAPYPTNPSFKFVYLRTFIRRDSEWKLVFCLEHAPAMNLSVAKSGGDLVSRAEEVISETGLLDLDFVTTFLFDDIINDKP
jgi:hypothetical protein